MTSGAETHGLVRQLTVEQAEAEHLVQGDGLLAGMNGAIFGQISPESW